MLWSDQDQDVHAIYEKNAAERWSMRKPEDALRRRRGRG